MAQNKRLTVYKPPYLNALVSMNLCLFHHVIKECMYKNVNERHVKSQL